MATPIPAPGDRQRELFAEQQKLMQLQRLMDMTCALLGQSHVSLLEACALIRQAKAHALQLFPDKAATFELLYRRRFARILEERLQFAPEFLN